MVNSIQPNKVRKGNTLLIAALLVGVLNRNLSIFIFKEALPSQGGLNLLVSVESTALGAFFIYYVSQKKNWARIIMAILAGISAISFLFTIGKLFRLVP